MTAEQSNVETTEAFRVLSMNMQNGGTRDAEGNPNSRLHNLIDVVRGRAPDVLLAQELRRWDEDNHKTVAEAEHLSGLRFAGGLTFGRSDSAVGVLINPARCRWTQWETRYRTETHHGLGVVLLDVGLELPLTVISAHLTPYSAAGAAQEAQIAAARAWRYRGISIIGGDINHFSVDKRAPDPGEIPPYNRSSRWLPSDSGPRPNRVVGETLALAGLTDTAVHFYETTENESYLNSTGGGKVRVDQFWVTPALVPALRRYETVDHGFSDHSGILLDLDLAAIDVNESNQWG